MEYKVEWPHFYVLGGIIQTLSNEIRKVLFTCSYTSGDMVFVSVMATF